MIVLEIIKTIIIMIVLVLETIILQRWNIELTHLIITHGSYLKRKVYLHSIYTMSCMYVYHKV